MIRKFEHVNNKNKQYEHETPLPIRKTKYSAGYDFLAPIDIELKPKEKRVIWTDVKAFMQNNDFLAIFIRSSLGIKHDLSICNGTGIIDSDYYSNESNDGNIGICLKNNGKDLVKISKNEGIAQGIFLNYQISDNCNSKSERVGGIGSTTKGD